MLLYLSLTETHLFICLDDPHTLTTAQLTVHPLDWWGSKLFRRDGRDASSVEPAGRLDHQPFGSVGEDAEVWSGESSEENPIMERDVVIYVLVPLANKEPIPVPAPVASCRSLVEKLRERLVEWDSGEDSSGAECNQEEREGADVVPTHILEEEERERMERDLAPPPGYKILIFKEGSTQMQPPSL